MPFFLKLEGQVFGPFFQMDTQAYRSAGFYESNAPRFLEGYIHGDEKDRKRQSALS